jgi:RNA polymerase sigma-70 factor, ECF subfamily
MEATASRVLRLQQPGRFPRYGRTGIKSREHDGDSWKADPDVAFMERVRDGDTEAFEVLFKKHSSAVVKFAYGFLGSRSRAEEVAQNAFLQLFRARKRYQPIARFSTYLYRIASNLCLNELRRFDLSGKIESLDVEDDSNGASLAERLAGKNSTGPARQLACREIANEVQKVLARLPANQRVALLLSRVDGFSYREVAESLDSSVSAVKSLIFRATAALRRELHDVVA